MVSSFLYDQTEDEPETYCLSKKKIEFHTARLTIFQSKGLSGLASLGECPHPTFCPYGFRPFEIKRDNLNETQWEKSRCGENPESSKKKIGYEYVVGLAPSQTCCSLAMWRYKNPFVIWVRCYMKSNNST